MVLRALANLRSIHVDYPRLFKRKNFPLQGNLVVLTYFEVWAQYTWVTLGSQDFPSRGFIGFIGLSTPVDCFIYKAV